MTLGSAKSNDVLVPGALMSRQHALFELETERWRGVVGREVGAGPSGAEQLGGCLTETAGTAD